MLAPFVVVFCPAVHYIFLRMQNSRIFFSFILIVLFSKQFSGLAVLHARSALNHSPAKSRSNQSLSEINRNNPSVREIDFVLV